ncbi:hypothetical protein AC249_AIPGENE16571 [Exaiptasia diaphana]|nr:hypothetical protein AC249_AIPGENE16571 [Exaiptasia diaphana]
MQGFCLVFLVAHVDKVVAKPQPRYTSLAKCIGLSSSSTPNQILDRLTANMYAMISPTTGKASRAPASRNKLNTKSLRCPFIWTIDKDPNRLPSILLKAKLSACPKSNTACATNCHPITYGHQVLKFKCSDVWEWTTVNLPIGYF